MSSGMKYGGASSSTKISTSYTASLMFDTKQSYGANMSVDHTMSCTAPPEGGVGFWQWKTSTHDGKSTVLSNHTICRYGP